jgi:hypothetical protein
MNAKLLSGWLDAPDTLGREAGAQLDALTRSFPYFQTAQLLYIKTLHNENSFLYNNQLKVAAAYASNRRMLYELITRKTPVSEKIVPETITVQPQPEPIAETTAPETVADLVPEPAVIPEPVLTASDTEIVQPEFPKKRFAASDEWEAGMLRQLQLLHHWRNQPETVKPATLPNETPEPAPQPEAATETEISAPAEPASSNEPGEPTAADEINTLLYVLAEPGDWEDEPITEELSAPETTEITAEEPATWEVQPVEDITEEKTAPAAETEIPALLTSENISIPAALPDDPIEQLILAGAVNASITQEVDDRWPSPDELQPKQKATEEQPAAETPEAPATPETPEIAVITETTEAIQTEEAGEMSFSGWLKKLSHQTPAPETVQEPENALPEQKITEISTEIPENKVAEEINVEKSEAELPEVAEEKIPTEKQQIMDRFIREEPRIKPNKNKFYNPVNMAKQSVQESDEFITETLARIYVKQGNLSKAIRAYQKLSLKFPEKSTYFAALIEELKRTPK